MIVAAELEVAELVVAGAGGFEAARTIAGGRVDTEDVVESDV